MSPADPGSPEPEVSIIIPAHDPEWLERTLASALEQRDVRSEVVIVDDGSRAPVASLLAPEVEKRVRLIRHETARGVSAARNAGIARARAPWLAFLDHDDIWAPSKLRSLLDLAAAADADFAYSSGVTIDADGRVLGVQQAPPPEGLERAMLAGSAIPYIPSNIVARTETVNSAGGFDPDLNFLGDWDLALRLSAAGTAAMTPAQLVGYTLHDSNMHSDEAGFQSELPLFDRKHAQARAALGVSVNRAFLVGRRANARRRSGDNRGAAADYMRLGWLRRDPRPVARGIVLGLGGDPVIGLARRLVRRDQRLATLAPAWLDRAARPPRHVIREVTVD